MCCLISLEICRLSTRSETKIMRKKGRQMDMQNDKLVTNSFDFSSVSFSLEEVPCSVQPLSFDESLCIGCGTCARVCQCDILFPSDKKGTHPIVAYPGECYYCGACVMACPRPGAISLNHPLRNRAKFVPIISQ